MTHDKIKLPTIPSLAVIKTYKKKLQASEK